MTDCADARTLLFVPGNRPARFEKAVRSGADAVILDLEDSVPQTEKSAARGAVEAEWAKLMGFGVPLLVRINGGGSKESRSDVDLLTRLTGAAGVVCPKAESGAALTSLHDELGGVPLLPIVESAVGFTELASIAGSRGVVRFVVGSIDFMADTGLQCDDVESELAPLRFAVAMATRVHRLHAAIDGVTVQVTDDLKLRDDTRRALRFGFGGKLCIHPRQVGIVHEAFAPSEHELDWARRVIAADAASGGAAVQLDGRMVDAPVVRQAQRTLARAASTSRR